MKVDKDYHKMMQIKLTFKEEFVFDQPDLIAAKWDYLERIEYCLSQNLIDSSIPNQIYALKYISNYYFVHKQIAWKADSVDRETIDICEFIISRLDIKIAYLLDLEKIADKKAQKTLAKISNKNVISEFSTAKINNANRYKRFEETYNHFTRVEKLSHIDAEERTCERHDISMKTLSRAIKKS